MDVLDSIPGDGAHVKLPGGAAHCVNVLDSIPEMLPTSSYLEMYCSSLVDVLDSIPGDGAHVKLPGGVALCVDVLDSIWSPHQATWRCNVL